MVLLYRTTGVIHQTSRRAPHGSPQKAVNNSADMRNSLANVHPFPILADAETRRARLRISRFQHR